MIATQYALAGNFGVAKIYLLYYRAKVGPKIFLVQLTTHGGFTIILPTLSQTPLLRLLLLPKDGRRRTGRLKKTASGARAVNTTREHVVNTSG